MAAGDERDDDLDDDLEELDEFDHLDAADGPAWIEPDDDDGFRLTIDPEVLSIMTTRLAQGAAAFSSDLSVQVDGPDGPRELLRSELDELIATASAGCLELVERSPATIDQEEAIELAQCAGLLATIWSMAFQADDPEGDVRQRELAWVAAIGKLAADCEDMFVTRIRPRSDGTFALKWSVVDRAVIRESIGQVRSLMSTDDPAVSRLFPTAYGSDAERNAGWDVFMRGELIERRAAALDIADRLMTQRRCTVDELNAFMRCLNDARLVLGTQLDVDEDGLPADVDGSTRSDRLVYEHLTHLLGRTVDALEAAL